MNWRITLLCIALWVCLSLIMWAITGSKESGMLLSAIMIGYVVWDEQRKQRSSSQASGC